MSVMKKHFLLSCLLLFLGLSLANAQSQVGIRAGANWANINDGLDAKEGVDDLWNPGLVIGVASSFHLSDVVAVAPEINYSRRGTRYEGNILGTDYVAKYNYLEVPVLIRASFGDVLKGYINAGPAFSYWLGGTVEGDGVFEGDVDFDDDNYDDANRFEVGGAIGGGIQLDTEAGSFLIDLRYTQGFTDFQDNYVNILGDDDADKAKNRLVSVSLIFLVPTIR